MKNSTISFLQSLKTLPQYQSLRYDQLIIILSNNQLTLHQIRKYLLHIYPSIDLSWRDNFTQQDIMMQLNEIRQYISNHRKYWNDQSLSYDNHLNAYSKEHLQIKNKLRLDESITDKQLFQYLTKYLQQQNIYINSNRNLQGINQIVKEHHHLQQFNQHLEKIIIYQYQQSKLQTIYDHDLQTQVNKILLARTSNIMKEKSQYDPLIDINDKYQKELSMIRSKLKQIFLFYCRQHNLKSLSFQELNRFSQMLDLRLYLLYVKDYKYQEINKYKYSLSKMTQIFKKYAIHTHHLGSQEFWNLHVELFSMKIITINKQQLLSINKDRIQEQKFKYQQQIIKINELNDILINNKMVENFKYDYKYENLKTQFNNLKKHSSSLAYLGLKNSPLGKQKGTQSSRFTNKNKKSIPSSKDSKLSSMNRNFIQSIRQEINNEQRGIIKNKSYKNIVQKQNPEKITSIHLPQILKMSTQELANQGIYQSLKKFPAFDYLAQQKKIRGIIGLSEGEDELQQLKQFFSKEFRNRKQKEKSMIIKRQMKRKQIISQSKVHKHHCRKFHPEQVQPYMRF